MRSLLLVPALLLAAACSNTPAPGSPGSPGPGSPGLGSPDIAPAPTGDLAARCPAPDEPCMNADNHAQCLELASTCKGEILQAESCPVQFTCSVSDPHAPVASPPLTGGYEPCAGKRCGDACQICPPGDADCVETMELKTCDAAGKCSGTAASCE